jgi:dihydrolipoamide dehydrogenase
MDEEQMSSSNDYVIALGSGTPGESAAYEERRGFLTLVSDGNRLTGAYALGPDAGEWMQQATLAIRADAPIEIINGTIQPFPTFSEIFYYALAKLSTKIPAPAG